MANCTVCAETEHTKCCVLAAVCWEASCCVYHNTKLISTCMLHTAAALHNLVGDLRALPAVDQMFDACHQIIGLFSAEKALKRAYKAKCAGLGTSGYLRLAPSHRFAYQVGHQRRASYCPCAAHKCAQQMCCIACHARNIAPPCVLPVTIKCMCCCPCCRCMRLRMCWPTSVPWQA